MAQPPPRDTNIKLYPTITKSDIRQLKRITRLINTAKTCFPNQRQTHQPQPTPNTPNKPSTSQQNPTTSRPTQLRGHTVLVQQSHSHNHKQSQYRKLVDSLRKKEEQLYRKTPKRYQNNLKPRRAYNLTPKSNPNLKPYETQPPTTSKHTHPKSSTYYKHTLRKNTSAAPRTTSHLLHGKILLTRTLTPTSKPTHPHLNTHATTTSQRAITPPHATRRRPVKPLAQTQSQIKSSNTYQNRHTTSSTSCSN